MTDSEQSESHDTHDKGVDRLKDELQKRRHLEYVEVRRAETGEVVVENVAPESAHFNNAEFNAFYAADFVPVHVECDSEEVWLRGQ